MHAIPVPMNFRATISRTTNLAWLTGELQPLVAALSEARAYTGRLLAQFQAAAAEGPGAI